MAIVVAAFFIVSPFLSDSIDVLDFWYVLDVLMLIALAIALPYNYARKRRECDGDPDSGASPAATWKPTSPSI